jgi:hypothetical protein
MKGPLKLVEIFPMIIIITKILKSLIPAIFVPMHTTYSYVHITTSQLYTVTQPQPTHPDTEQQVSTMKFLLVSAVCVLIPSSQAQFTSFLGSRALGFSPAGFRNPSHPLGLPHLSQLPKPAQPPTLLLQVPPNACGFVCSLLDLLLFNPIFSTFISAVKAAGLVGLLTEPGPVTIFAPTNAAFDGLPPVKFQVGSKKP